MIVSADESADIRSNTRSGQVNAKKWSWKLKKFEKNEFYFKIRASKSQFWVMSKVYGPD